MYAQERHREILDRTRADGRVEVTALAELLQVTPETIRRDLTVLERHGVLRRVHGGAVPVDRHGFEPGVAARETIRLAEKERIAQAALRELPDEGAIILDAGTTTLRLAEALPLDRELTVVTNSLPIAVLLASRPNLTVLVVGGRVRGRTLATVGPWADRTLEGVYADVAFLGTNSLSVERGLTTPDMAESDVKRAFARSARRVVVLADHTKIGAIGFAHVARLEDIDVLITDSGVADDLVSAIREAGPQVVIA